MDILFLLVINYLIVSVWLRLAQQLFPRTDDGLGQWGFAGGTLVAAALALYPVLLRVVDLEGLRYSISSLSLSPSILLAALGYLGLVRRLRHLVSSRHSTGKLALLFVTSSGMALFLGFTVGLRSVPVSLLYFVYAASIEESGKFFFSQSLAVKTPLLQQETVLFALLVSLGFAFLENSLYLRFALGDRLSVIEGLTQGAGLLVSRGTISFLIHAIFTGTIAAIALRLVKRFPSVGGRIGAYAVALLIGIVLHAGRNLLLAYHVQRAVVLLVVGAYFLLAYLLYQSDSLYLKQRLAQE